MTMACRQRSSLFLVLFIMAIFVAQPVIANNTTDISGFQSLFPEATGAVWSVGEGRIIRWISNNALPPNAVTPNTVKLALYRNSKLIVEIVGSTPDNGNFAWTIPGSIPPHHSYYIHIESTKNPLVFIDSKFFEIAAQGALAGPYGNPAGVLVGMIGAFDRVQMGTKERIRFVNILLDEMSVVLPCTRERLEITEINPGLVVSIKIFPEISNATQPEPLIQELIRQVNDPGSMLKKQPSAHNIFATLGRNRDEVFAARQLEHPEPVKLQNSGAVSGGGIGMAILAVSYIGIYMLVKKQQQREAQGAIERQRLAEEEMGRQEKLSMQSKLPSWFHSGLQGWAKNASEMMDARKDAEFLHGGKKR